MSIEDVIKQIEKEHGKNSIMSLGDTEIEGIESIPTGILSLDKHLKGGIPKGRITEVYGNESSGKTTLCLQVIAECQKMGGNVAFIDAEHALDIEYAQILGIKLDDLLLSQPDNGEQALNIVESLVRSEEIDLVVIDSVSALTPRAEIEGEMGDSHMGLQARLMSQALRKLTGIIAKANCAVIFINQIRSKIGIVFGNPETTSGGNALKFYASLRIELKKFGQVKSKEEVIGTKARIKIVKSKVSPPFRQVELDLCYGIGFDNNKELLDLLVEKEIFEKHGAWYKYQEEKFQGEIATKQYIKENYDKLLKEAEE